MNSLPERCSKKLNQEYPTFSDAEFARHRKAFEAAMEHRGVRHVIIRGALKVGPSIQWLTGWPVTAEAVIDMTRDYIRLRWVKSAEELD